MVVEEATRTIPHTSVLVQQLDLPADLSWFNDLGTEERDKFFRGLMIVLTSPQSKWQTAVESHLQHWQIAVEVAARQDKPVLDVIRVYQPKPRKTPFELFVETVHELRVFEEEYGMTSAEFYEKFQAGEIEEGPWDYFEWRSLYGGFLFMKERYDFSEDQVPRGQQ